MSEGRTGRCLCGAVHFAVRGALRAVVACHCVECRRQSGHFVAATSVADDELSVTGADAVRWYRSSGSARRGFCGTCGSLLFWKHDAEARISIMAGAFDRPTGLSLVSHIFCAEKGDYYHLDDGLARFDGADPALRVPER